MEEKVRKNVNMQQSSRDYSAIDFLTSSAINFLVNQHQSLLLNKIEVSIKTCSLK